MTEFPPPVSPPENVDHARQRRLNQVSWATLSGIALRCAIVIVELAGGWWFGSAVLLVDGAASLADVLASVGLLWAMRLAARPPDEDHPFGHGRYEPLAGLQLSVLICLAGLWLAVQHGHAAFTEAAADDVAAYLWMIPALAALLLEACARVVSRVARKYGSSALVAEARHYRIDALTSLFAAAALMAASVMPAVANVIDLGAAVFLASVMLALGAMAAWENLHQVTDRVPDAEFFDRVARATRSVEGVLDVEKVRIQRAGPDAHVDIDVEVDPQQTVAEAHRIAQHVRARIQEEWPLVREVVVHVEPYFRDDH